MAVGLIDSNGGILFGARGVLTACGEYYQRCAASGERFIESMQKAAWGLAVKRHGAKPAYLPLLGYYVKRFADQNFKI